MSDQKMGILWVVNMKINLNNLILKMKNKRSKNYKESTFMKMITLMNRIKMNKKVMNLRNSIQMII